MTNPEVFRETVKSHGQNLIKGLNNLLHDVEAGDGQLRIRMTDTSAFEMGKNVATTPGKVVFQNELFQLIQYDPARPRTSTSAAPDRAAVDQQVLHPRPARQELHGQVGDRSGPHHLRHVLDQSGRQAGRQEDFENYLLEGSMKPSTRSAPRPAKQRQRGRLLPGRHADHDHAGLHGGQEGQARAFCHLLHDHARLLRAGRTGSSSTKASCQDSKRRWPKSGFLEGSEMATTFNMLRANDLIWSFVVNNYLMGKDPFPFDLLYWNSDSTRMPAAMHSYYLRNMYLGNLLKEPGGITLGGVKIDISKVKTPCYFISTIEDHIAPWKSTYMGARLPSGNTKFVLGGSGHIAGIVNPPAANKYGFWTNDATDGNLPESPEDFLAGATQNAGSWWTHWNTWVTSLPGGSAKVKARNAEDGSLKVIEPAPGSYVKFRLDTQKKAS
jgi:polyhydroxyalkanoate synthase